MPTQPGQRLETVANVLAIATCCILLVLVASHWPFRNLRLSSTPRQTTYRIGDVIAVTSGIQPVGASRAFLLALRADCGYCAASLPFYKSLLAELRARSPETRVIVVSPDAPDYLERHLLSKGLKADSVVQVGPGSLRIARTPTVILLDRTAKIEGIWEGLLSREKEKEVLSLVTAANR
jgi:hypothetical protein